MKKSIRYVTGIVLLFLGMGIFWYPEVSEVQFSRKTVQFMKDFEKKHPDTETEKDTLYQEIDSYNQSLYQTGQTAFADPWVVTEIPGISGLEAYREMPFGYIHIPAMHTALPVYLGASMAHMAKGAAVLGETSVPVGGENTNSVIAAHRGYRGKAFFRDIEKLQAGDRVEIRNPWKTLLYTVESIRCIAPCDSEAVKIRKGQDMLTLLTCHPYRGHGKWRYVVYCVRDKDAENKGNTQRMENERKDAEVKTAVRQSAGTAVQREKITRRIGGALLLCMCFVTLKKKKQRLNRDLETIKEKYGRKNSESSL